MDKKEFAARQRRVSIVLVKALYKMNSVFYVEASIKSKVLIMSKRILAIIPFLFACSAVESRSIKQADFGSLEVSKVTSIYDGDTFRANLKDVHPLIGKRIGIRVSGVDTPEIKGKCFKEKMLAQKAKQFTVSILRSAKRIELRNVKRGKYFRIVANVFADGNSLTEQLINSGLGVSYSGGKKIKNWCK